MIQKNIDVNGLTVGGNELVEIPITNESHGVTKSKSQSTWKRVSKAEQKKRKIDGCKNNKGTKKQCELDNAVLGGDESSLEGVGIDQPCQSL